LPRTKGFPRRQTRTLFIRKITRRLLDSFRKDIKRPLAEGLVVDGHGGTLLSFVAHTAEHTLSSDWNVQLYTPAPTPGTSKHRLVVPQMCQGGAGSAGLRRLLRRSLPRLRNPARIG